MSRTKEYYHDVINQIDDVDESDYEYFQWLTNAQWEEAVEEERERLQNMYGSGAHMKLKFGEFLNKNS